MVQEYPRVKFDQTKLAHRHLVAIKLQWWISVSEKHLEIQKLGCLRMNFRIISAVSGLKKKESDHLLSPITHFQHNYNTCGSQKYHECFHTVARYVMEVWRFSFYRQRIKHRGETGSLIDRNIFFEYGTQILPLRETESSLC